MDVSKIPTKDREFVEVNGGYYDDEGFFLTPNGSIDVSNTRLLGSRRILFQ
jgi:hypothetical protein